MAMLKKRPWFFILRLLFQKLKTASISFGNNFHMQPLRLTNSQQQTDDGYLGSMVQHGPSHISIITISAYSMQYSSIDDISYAIGPVVNGSILSVVSCCAPVLIKANNHDRRMDVSNSSTTPKERESCRASRQ